MFTQKRNRHTHQESVFNNLSTVFANSFGNYTEKEKPDKIYTQAEYIYETMIHGAAYSYGTSVCDRKRVIAVMDFFP